MKKTLSSKILLSSIVALGAAAAVLPISIYRYVETAGMHGMSMHCETACVSAAAIGAVVALAAVLSLFFSGARLNVGAAAVILAGGIAMIAVPWLLGFCESEGMACRYIMAPTLIVLGVAAIALSAVRLVSGVSGIRKEASA